jgi:hypothetical protein
MVSIIGIINILKVAQKDTSFTPGLKARSSSSSFEGLINMLKKTMIQ